MFDLQQSEELALTLYHAPRTRSSGVLGLLEELSAPYHLELLDLKSGEHKRPDYLAINPLGKVPTLLHHGAVITEQVAIHLYLADLFPAAGLTPAIGDPLRGPYLRWMTIYGSSFEPAMVDRALNREPGDRTISPYGDSNTLLAALSVQLERHDYLLGDRFLACDVLWGTSLDWMLRFQLLPDNPYFGAYARRVSERPKIAHSRAYDEDLADALALRRGD